MSTGQQERIYTAQVVGRAAVDKAAEVVHDGGARYIVVRKTDGRPAVEVPVIAGVVMVVAAPLVSTAAAVAALSCGWTIRVERRPDERATPS
ncbi:DUF4342 domain-containing protein [Actinosynnema sp. NPDC051121]